MKASTYSLYFVLSLLNNFKRPPYGRFDVFVDSLRLCDPNFDYPNKIYAMFRTVEAKQYMDGNATFKIPLDDEARFNVTVESRVSRRYVPLVTIDEKRACSSMHRYLGEFIYDVERHAQLIPGMCPIAAGRYRVHNYQLDFDRMTLQSFPFGKMRVTSVVTTGKTDKLSMCFLAEVENRAQ